MLPDFCGHADLRDDFETDGEVFDEMPDLCECCGMRNVQTKLRYRSVLCYECSLATAGDRKVKEDREDR